MNRDTFATLALATFGLVFLGFVVVGFSRIVLPYRTARLLGAPFLALAAAGAVALFVVSLLAVTGIKRLDE